MSIHQSFFIDKTVTYLGSGGITQNTALGTSLVLNVPSGTQPGDLLIAIMSPSGGNGSFTQASFTFAAAPTLRGAPSVAYKEVTTSAEPASYTFTCNNSRTLTGVIIAYRNADFDVVGTVATSAGGNLTVTGITPSKSDSILFAVGTVDGQETITAPTGMTTLIDGTTDATNPDFSIFSRASRAVASGNQTIGFSGGNNNGGVLFSIIPV